MAAAQRMRWSDRHETQGMLQWSPDGRHLAMLHRPSSAAATHQVRILDSSTLEVRHAKDVLSKVHKIGWSPNSRKIFAAQFETATVDIFGISHLLQDEDEDFEEEEEAEEWEIREGLAGLRNAFWTPDSNYLVTLTEFEIRLTIWDLNRKITHYVEFPKFTDKGHEFSPNGRFFAVIERSGDENHVSDSICLFSTVEWVKITRFKVQSLDVQDIKWSPDNRHICAIDSPLEYRFFIYNLKGDLVAMFEAYENALGIKSYLWSPTGQFFSVGSYDQCVRIFNTSSWKCVTVLNFPHNIKQGDRRCSNTCVIEEITFGQEEESGGDDASPNHITSRSNLAKLRTSRIRKRIPSARITKEKKIIKKKPEKQKEKRTQYKIRELPFRIPEKKIQLVANPKVGIGMMDWSSCGRYLAVINDHMDTTVWIWDIYTLSIRAILTHMNPVKKITWDPVHLRLAISCQNENLYLWNEYGAVTIRLVTGHLNIRRLKWRPDGNALYVADKKHFSCVYPEFNEE